MNMSDDSTLSPVQALKALWQKHAGVPEEGTEDAGRWEVLRRAAAAQGEGVAFDEWVLEQEARLDERGMLIDASYGRATKTVILMDTDHVILSALTPEVLSERWQGRQENEGERNE